MTSALDTLASRGQNIAISRGGGVYALIDEHGVVLYVGQSRCLWKRIASHIGEVPFARCLVIDADRRWRLKYERALIRVFLPRFNTKIPGHSEHDAKSLARLGIDSSLLDHAAIEQRRAPDITNRRNKALKLWATNPHFTRRRVAS